MGEKRQSFFIFLDASAPRITEKELKEFIQYLPHYLQENFCFKVFELPPKIRSKPDWQVVLYLKNKILVIDDFARGQPHQPIYLFITYDNNFVEDAENGLENGANREDFNSIDFPDESKIVFKEMVDNKFGERVCVRSVKMTVLHIGAETGEKRVEKVQNIFREISNKLTRIA